MSSKDIIQSIQKKADKEIEDQKQTFDSKKSELEKAYTEKISKKKEQLLKDIQLKVDKKVSQARFQASFLLNSKLLKKKQEIIAQVYQKSLDRLAEADEEKQTAMISKLIKSLPRLEKGKIIPSKESESVIRKVLQDTDLNYEVSDQVVDSKGGFVFESGGLTIDNTLESIVKALKEQTETEVSSILFSS